MSSSLIESCAVFVKVSACRRSMTTLCITVMASGGPLSESSAHEAGDLTVADTACGHVAGHVGRFRFDSGNRCWPCLSEQVRKAEFPSKQVDSNKKKDARPAGKRSSGIPPGYPQRVRCRLRVQCAVSHWARVFIWLKEGGFIRTKSGLKQ